MKIKIYLLALLFATTFYSCIQTTESKVENAITEITEKFSQFRKGKSKQSEYYKLLRSVTHGENEFQLQLRSEPDSLNDPQQILVLINSKYECRAIPFFSNTYRDYWEFKFEKPIPSVLKTNTTFNKEFSNALESLRLDTFSIGSKVIDEMLFSLLNCEVVTEKDSSEIFTGIYNKNQDLKNEIFDKKTEERFKQNYMELSKNWNDENDFSNYNSYYDKKNFRIYQVIMDVGYYNEPFKLKIKCYRQNAIFNPITM